VCIGRSVGAAGFARTVAIKRLHPHLAKDPEFSAMFLDEARLAARVRHPSVVATLDVVAGDGELCLVMEYVPGASLASLLRATTRIPPAIASSILSGVLHGLHAAHEARAEDGRPLEIVHRDVSPQNILVGEDGVARLIDFGIARAAVRSQSTRDGQLKGKLRYMAPEQLRGAPATRRADVYAAAVVLWEALTGERLFDGDTDGATYGLILEGVVRPPSAFAEGSADLDAVRRDPGARYPTALAMAEALEAAAPPAPAREVAAWLKQVAGPALAQRARRVQQIEQGAPDGGGPGADVDELAGGDLHTGTLTSAGAGEPEGRTATGMAPPMDDAAFEAAPLPAEHRPAQRKRLPAFAVAGVLGVALAAALIAGTSPRPEVVPARRGLSAAVLLASLRTTIVRVPVATATTVAAAVSSSVEPPPAQAVRKAPPAVTVRARSACDPPYTIDAGGIRRVKRECL
jgi:hypothetical protein